MLSKATANGLPEGVLVGKEKLSLYNIIVTLTLTVGALAVAMPSAIISTTLGQPSFLEYFNLITGSGLRAGRVAALNGLFYTGGVCGLIALSFISDRIGRKNTLRLGALSTIICSGCLAGSVNISMFIVFRFLSGFSSALSNGTVPVLMSEVAPPHSRGLMVGMYGIALACGYSLASWLGVAFYFCHDDAVQWRLPLALTGVPSVLILFLLPLVPESPRWLFIKGRVEEAARVVHRLHGSSKDSRLEDFSNLEIEQMKAQIAFEQQNNVTWFEFLTSRVYARRVWTAAFSFMTSQSAGVLVVVTYSATITESIGYGPVVQLCLSAGYLTIGIMAAIIGSLIIDRVGRVRLLVMGTILQVIMMIIITTLIAKFAGTTNTAANKICIGLIFIYFFIYGVFIEGTVYTYLSEMFPSHVRAKGVSWGLIFLYLTDIPFVTGATYAFNSIGWRYYLVFIIVPIASLTALVLLAKETKGKSLEEIGIIFGDKLVIRTLDEQIEEEKNGVHRVSAAKERSAVELKEYQV